MELQIPTVTIDDLRAFHAKHFPSAHTAHYLHGNIEQAAADAQEEQDDGLGYYEDGTERTLTDEQIAMFRNSEIRKILRTRRSQRENGELAEEGEVAWSSGADADSGHTHDRQTSVDSTRTTAQPPAVINEIQCGRVEEPITHQWATSSERTKKRNRRNREKYKARKKEERLEKERNDKKEDEAHESDEWDAWHQANGPDAQKDDPLELDY